MPYLGNVPSSFNVSTNNIDNGAVTTEKIADGAVVNADVSASAAIAGTKISPDFGSQNLLTTGTATAASFIPSSSTTPTNGVYLPAANTVGISTGGSGRLFVDASGNVKLGSAPDGWSGFRALQVGGSTSIWSSTTGAGSSFYSNNVYYNGTNRIYTNTGFATEYIQDTSAGDHIFFTASSGTAGGAVTFSEKFRIKNNGSVGVGDSSPGHKLVVRQNNSGGIAAIHLPEDESTILGSTANTNIKMGGNLTVSASGVLGLNTNGSERLRITSTGLVGIGTSAPSSLLHLQTTSANVVMQMLENNGSTVYGASIDAFNSSGGNIRVRLHDSGGTYQERLRITSAGNVGIGTTSPGNLLTVSTNTDGTTSLLKLHADADGVNNGLAGIKLSGNAGDHAAYIYGGHSTSGNTFLSFYTDLYAGTYNPQEKMRLDANGRLLVGTSSSTGANVKGVFGAGLASSDGVLVVNTNDQAINAITISNWDGATTTNGAKMTFSNSGIGDFIIGAGSGINRFEVFNGAGTGVFLTSGNTSWTSTSDERLKTDLAPIENAIDRVNSLRAVTGRFKTDEEGVSRGFLIAQDVQLVFPEAVDNSNPDELGVRYTEVIPLLVAALKESKERIEALEAKVAALETA